MDTWLQQGDQGCAPEEPDGHVDIGEMVLGVMSRVPLHVHHRFITGCPEARQLIH
jgi:hypothetical protein